MKHILAVIKENENEFNELSKLTRCINGNPNQKERDEWISASPFQNQIQQVQAIINRLDSFLVWNGRAKAQAIRNALNRAIDAAIKHEAGSTDKKRFQDFSEFAQFTKPNTGLFSTHYPNLGTALSIHRFEDIDALFEKDKPDSYSVISKK